MAAPQELKKMIWSGQGPVMMGDYAPGVGTKEMGFLTNLKRIGCGNRTLTTTPARETKALKESCSGQRLDMAELEQGKSLTVKLEMFQFDGRMLATAFFGENVVRAAGTVTGEALPPLVPGDYVFLKHPNVSSVVIEDSTAVTPVVLIEGTHYVIESGAHSRIQIIKLPVGAVLPLTVDYAHGGYSNIAAFSAGSTVRKGLVFNGQNQDGDTVRVIIPQISFAMNGDFSWIGDEEAVLSLEGPAFYSAELSNDADFGPFMRIDGLPGLN